MGYHANWIVVIYQGNDLPVSVNVCRLREYKNFWPSCEDNIVVTFDESLSSFADDRMEGYGFHAESCTFWRLESSENRITRVTASHLTASIANVEARFSVKHLLAKLTSHLRWTLTVQVAAKGAWMLILSWSYPVPKHFRERTMQYYDDIRRVGAIENSSADGHRKYLGIVLQPSNFPDEKTIWQSSFWESVFT